MNNALQHSQFSYKLNLWSVDGKTSIIGKAMTVYENPDDHGTLLTWESQEFGSTGSRIACCEIREIYIPDLVDEEESDDDNAYKIICR